MATESIAYNAETKICYVLILVMLAGILITFYASYKHYLKQKPLGLQTLLDSVHVDLAYCYTACFCSFSLSNALAIAIGKPVNQYVAIALGWHSLTRFYALWIAITQATVMRYVHIYHSWTLEKLNRSDEFIRKCLYYSNLNSSALLAAYLSWYHDSNM